VEQLQSEIRSKNVGQPVTLDVVRLDPSRDERKVKIKVKTGELPENTLTTSKPKVVEETDSKGLGIKVQALTPELAEKFKVELKAGVLVTQIEENSLAAGAGISPGDIITGINRRKVTNPKEFKDALKTADTKKGVLIHLVNERGRGFEILKDSGD